MELHDTVPRVREADDKQDAIEEPEPGVAKHTDGEEDAPEKLPSVREDPVSSNKDERSGSVGSFTWRPHLIDCQDAGCTWPCADHFHSFKKERDFEWYPDLEHSGYDHSTILPRNPEMKVGMKDCQFCCISFTIWQSECACRASADDDHILESPSCNVSFSIEWAGLPCVGISEMRSSPVRTWVADR